MNKDQFKLQIYNNRYIRGVIVTICKIIIWTLIYALILGVTTSVVSTEINSLTTRNFYNANSLPTFSAGAVLACLIIVVVTIAYYWAVIAEIIRKIKQNQKLYEVEEEYLSNKSSKD